MLTVVNMRLLKRRERDSNPRYLAVHTLSRYGIALFYALIINTFIKLLIFQ